MEPLFSPQETQLRRYFFWSVLLKGLISFTEILAGVFVLVIPPERVTNLIIAAAQNELHEDPGSLIAGHILPIAQNLTFASTSFIAFYLMSRGLIKLVLVVALLKDQLWAYPASLAVLGMFIAYQLYAIALAHSLLVVLVTVFDLIVVYFIWREYTIVRKHLREKRP